MAISYHAEAEFTNEIKGEPIYSLPYTVRVGIKREIQKLKKEGRGDNLIFILKNADIATPFINA